MANPLRWLGLALVAWLAIVAVAPTVSGKLPPESAVDLAKRGVALAAEHREAEALEAFGQAIALAAERRSDAILAALGLSDKAEAYARTLSGGMRRRLMVAKAMVHDPPVLVLDEPTAGVDIELRQQLWAHVRELNRRGTTWRFQQSHVRSFRRGTAGRFRHSHGGSFRRGTAGWFRHAAIVVFEFRKGRRAQLQ